MAAAAAAAAAATEESDGDSRSSDALENSFAEDLLSSEDELCEHPAVLRRKVETGDLRSNLCCK